MTPERKERLRIEGVLRERQREALEATLSAASRGTHPKTPEAAQAALNAVLEHCESLEVPRDALAPLFALWEALEDLSQGVRSPMLERERRPGRPSHSIALLNLRRQAALAMDVMMKNMGLTMEVAARTVVKALSKRKGAPPFYDPFEDRRGERPWKIVAGWRAELMRAARNPSHPHFRDGDWYIFHRDLMLEILRGDRVEAARYVQKLME